MDAKKKNLKSLFRRKEYIYFFVFIILIVFLLISSRLTGRPPQIISITPKIGYPGDVMVITGRYFSETRNGGEVVISGYSPVSSGYLEWTDTRISLRIPDDVRSGLVRVITRNGKSKGLLFSNKKQIPVVLSGPGKPGQPYISSLDIKKGSIGTLLTVTGLNFGPQRGNSEVNFTWISGNENGKYDEANDSSLISALDYDQDYESWSDREIRVYIPDGASSGNLLVTTDKGESNAVYIEVEGAAGAKLFPEKRTYAVQYAIEIRDVSVAGENNLYIWVPQILEAPEQRNIQLVDQDPEPLFENVHGVKLFNLCNLVEDQVYRIIQSFMVDRYAIETKINQARVLSKYNTDRRMYKKYTAADEVIPSDNTRIVKLGKAIVGGEKNPFRKAKALYNWILKRLIISEEPVDYDIIEALDEKNADSYIYAVLFCALSRSVGIPARPVAGYIIDQEMTGTRYYWRHYWAEFFIEAIGWIPVDPYLGEGKKMVALAPEINPTQYYFGNLDFNHITFSKGLIQLNQMNPEGRAVRRKDIPSLQVIHEEAAGKLLSYSAYWSDIDIVGIY